MTHRLCKSENCMNEALPGRRYCAQCRYAHAQEYQHNSQLADVKRNSAAMKRSADEIREQLRLLAESDPFYARER